MTGVWRARRRTFVHAADPEQRLEMLTVWFEADARTTTATGGGDVEVSDDEIVEARWFERRPETVHEVFEERIEQWRQTAD